jgi:hypothetical protein
MISSRLRQAPSFDWLHEQPSIMSGNRYTPDFDAKLLAMNMGSAFHQLDIVDKELADVLRSAGEVTVALDHYQQGRPNAPSLTDVVNVALQTQHKLLRIHLSFHPPPSPSRIVFLREACHLAGLIYSDFVLFPLPPSTMVRSQLVRDLRVKIENFEVFEREEAEAARYEYGGISEYHTLLMWTLMIGALASSSRFDSHFFIGKLREYLRLVRFYAIWQSFHNLMKTYLWWDFIFYENALKLFQEMLPTPSPNSTITPRGSNESLHQGTAAAGLPVLTRERSGVTEIGEHGLPTPGSDHSPQGSFSLQWPHPYI